nr:hypothetical protein Itr_chr04CG21710 [Ipomoea trifida]
MFRRFLVVSVDSSPQQLHEFVAFAPTRRPATVIAAGGFIVEKPRASVGDGARNVHVEFAEAVVVEPRCGTRSRAGRTSRTGNCTAARLGFLPAEKWGVLQPWQTGFSSSGGLSSTKRWAWLKCCHNLPLEISHL